MFYPLLKIQNQIFLLLKHKWWRIPKQYLFSKVFNNNIRFWEPD